MVELLLWLGPVLLALLLFAVTIAIIGLSAQKVGLRMHLLAWPWLTVSIVGASLASLAQARFFPRSGSLFIGLGRPDRVHRGWPLPWVGMVAVERFFAPVALAIDTLIWALLSCALAYLMSLFAGKLKNRVLRGLALLLTAIAVTVLAYFLPFAIGAFE